MRIIVIGCNGQVGREICKDEYSLDVTIIGLDRTCLKLEDSEEIKNVIKDNCPDVVINAAAYTDVEKAETDSDCYMINGTALAAISLACNENNALLIHLSTDYVFSGDADREYYESDSTLPLNHYGKSKLLGEYIVQLLCQKHVIIRTSWVFSKHGRNFLKTMVRLFNEKDRLNVVNDQFGCPTSASSIARAALTVAECFKDESQNGIYHFSGIPAVSWFEYAREIAKIQSTKYGTKRVNICGISSTEFESKVKRPKISVLNCEKIKRTFNIDADDWKTSCRNVIDSLESCT